jgi:hypothetical protein
MSWLVFLAVLPSQPPQPHIDTEDDHHPTLSQTLKQLDEDVTQLQNPDLAAAERARLALRIRAAGERLPPLTDGQPTAVKQRSLDVERQCAKLFEATTHNRPIEQAVSQLSVSVHNLRSVIGP